MSLAPGSARARFAAAWVAVLVLGGSIWWGIHPPRTEHSYRQESAHSLQLLRSHVETARLWLDSVDAGKATSAAAEVALTETETDAERRAGSYSSYQPPDEAASKIRTRVTSLAARVVATLGEIRVDAQAGRWDEAVAAESDLERLSDQLRDLQRQVAP